MADPPPRLAVDLRERTNAAVAEPSDRPEACVDLVVLLLAVLTAVAFWGMGRLASSYDHTAEDVVPKVIAAEEVRYFAADLNGWQTGYVLDEGESRADFEKSLAGTRKALAELQKVSTDGSLSQEMQSDTARLVGLDRGDLRLDRGDRGVRPGARPHRRGPGAARGAVPHAMTFAELSRVC